MTRVYISGPMTGMPNLNFPAFNAAAEVLRVHGFDPVNPVDINPDPKATWVDCMRKDIPAVCTCDAIALLPGWEDSRGAHLEVFVARALGLKIRTLAALLQEGAK
jgi:hypothetical protein